MALSMPAEHHARLAPPDPPVQFPLPRAGIPHPYALPSPVDTVDHVPSKQSLNRHYFVQATGPIAIPRRRPHLRSLTPSMAVATMIMPEDTLPSSPPDLTDSRSSKSSSSVLSDSLAEDANHFEDIALEDVQEPVQSDLYHTRRTSSSKRSPPREIMAQVSQQPSGAVRGMPHPTTGLRDLTNSTRPKYPSLQGHVKSAIHDQSALNLPDRKQMRRGFTSPSSPSLPIVLGSGTRSRSPSPTPANHLHPSSRAGPRRIHTHSPGQRFAPRRQSWQPTRKSVKELEAEYHDSDEEVPEDAVIHNVPLSPRVNQRSATPSPERPSPFSLAYREDHRQQGKRPFVPAATESREPSPHSIVEPSSSRSLPPIVTENTPAFPPPRSKSWNIAMSDLSKEAQELSIALETHAEELTLSRRSSNTLPENNDLSLHRAKTASTVELPPVRKGNIMIDPLPISKEKEAVLTRTRPSWLPPKSQKEEKKHLKEYQKMMALSAEMDRRKAAKSEAAQLLLVDQRNTMEKIWETHVLPNWANVIGDKKTRELWWKGIAPKARGEVWQRAIGNELGLTDSSYEKALARAQAVEKELNATGEEEAAKKEAEWFKAIKRDAAHAFPELRIFQQGSPLHDDLVKVLMAYAMYRNDLGYVYGTHVSLLLLSPTCVC